MMAETASHPIRKVQTKLKFRQVADAIWMMLRQDQFGPGQRVPPEKELAERFGVSYMTIRKANADLIRRGIIQRKQGKGTFVTHLVGKRRGGKRVGFLAVGRDLEGPTLRHFQQVKQRLAGQSVELLFDSVTPFVDTQIIPPLFVRNSVDAIIAYGVLDEWLLRHLSQQPIPVLVSGSAPRVPRIPMVQVDHELLAYHTTRTLLNDLGYEQVWLVIEPLRLHLSRQVFTGYRRATTESAHAMELINLCENGHYESFVRNFRGGLRVLKGQQAIMWWTRCPFVNLETLGVEGRELVVVSAPRREGDWKLPAKQDLGCLMYPWELLAEQTVQALNELIQTGLGRSIDLQPQLRVATNDGQRSLDVQWRSSLRTAEELIPA